MNLLQQRLERLASERVSARAVERARARTITPRPYGFDVEESAPRHWMGGDAYSTHLMNTLSLVFPPGERMFIDSVRHYRGRIRDPELLTQVARFIAQEARHSREHHRFNTWLTEFGVDAEGIERALSAHIARRRARRTPLDDLAVTCAFEHITALLAESWLNERELRELAGEPFASLWTWHAIEELDHKSVALDVYRHVGGDELRRLRWMLRIGLSFTVGVSVLHLRLMRDDGTLRRPLYVARRLWKYWGPGGHFTPLVPGFLRYFRPGFHPWDVDHGTLITAFSQALAARSRWPCRGCVALEAVELAEPRPDDR